MAIDWQALKDEYAAGQLSYRALAQKYGVSASLVSATAKKSGWAAARRQHRGGAAEPTAKAQSARTSAQETEQLLRLQEIALDAVALLADVLRDPDQFKRHLVVSRTTGVGSMTEERVFEKLDMSAIRAYAASMQSLTTTIRNLFDLPTKREKQAMDIQNARLKLDQQKHVAADAGMAETGIAQIAAVLPQAGPDGDTWRANNIECPGGEGFADDPDDTGLRLMENLEADGGEGDFA